MPPIPLLTGAYANLASEEWILQEREQIRSLYDARLVDFHQSYVDDVSWLNEYMAGLCETAPTKGDILQAMKTPSRFQSVRKLNIKIDLKDVRPVARLFSESSTATESSRAISTTSEPAKITDSIEEPKRAAKTTKSHGKTELRGSMIIHHDTDEEVEVVSTTGDSMDILGDKSQFPIEEPPQPLNEIEEVEEDDDDEVVTVLKTPLPLHAKANLPSQEDLLESPLAGKGIPHHRNEEVNGSDKENIPTSSTFLTTPRPSDRSDSYVTAVSSLPLEENTSQESQPRSETLRPIDVPHEEERIIETQVPVATSPPEHQMQLPSLPTRAPLNMKKSFGVRKSQRKSLMESIAGRASIIPNRKTFFGQAQQTDQSNPTELTVKPVETKITPTEIVRPIVTPTEKVSNPLTSEEALRGEKDNEDTITIIDTELHLGDQRLKSKFTTESQRIHDALNSLKIKSTPGQPLRDAQERIAEIETPGPIRTTEVKASGVDEDEDWIPKKDCSSLIERLANNQNVGEIEKESVKTHVENSEIESPQDSTPTAIIVEKSLTPQLVKSHVKAAPGPPPQSPASVTFKNAAAQAVEVIRNAMAIITNPSPEPPPPQQTNLYPNLNEPMTEIQPSENFTLHCDDRASLDSTYFTQNDVPSQSSQIAQENVTEHRQSQTAMPPPRKDHLATKPKPVPVSIRVPTASQRQKELQKKALTQGTGIYPALTQSRSVPDLASPGKMARDDARMSTASLQSQSSFMRGGGQIKALNAAKIAKQREEQERERKALKKFEMERKRQEVLAKRQEEERRKHLPARGKIQKDEKKRVIEAMRPAKKLPPSPQKKQIREEAVKPSRQAPITMPTKAVKHVLEQEEAKPRTANYTGAGKSMGQPQHDQDVKRRRTDEVEDKEVITSKPMRVSVVKQDTKPTKSIGEPIRQPYTAELKKGIKISSAHQHVVLPAKNFMAPAEGVKFSNDPIAFGKPAAKRSGPPPPPKESIYPPSESIILPEIDSEYSDSEDDSPKKPSIVKPSWAESPILIAQLKRQQMINPDDVFGEIKPPAIDDIFRNNNRRGHSTFRPRTSSANWSGQDKLTREEIDEYARMMGYSKP